MSDPDSESEWEVVTSVTCSRFSFYAPEEDDAAIEFYVSLARIEEARNRRRAWTALRAWRFVRLSGHGQPLSGRRRLVFNKVA